MMRRIVRSSLRYRFLVLAAAAGMMLIGLGRIQNVPVDVFPEFAPPRVEIQTIALGMSTAEVESLVTVPIEQALAGIEGLNILRSKSVPQLSQIELIFTRETNLLRARQLVAEGDPSPLGRFEHRRPASLDLPDAPGVREQVDVSEHL